MYTEKDTRCPFCHTELKLKKKLPLSGAGKTPRLAAGDERLLKRSGGRRLSADKPALVPLANTSPLGARIDERPGLYVEVDEKLKIKKGATKTPKESFKIRKN